jgi:hypothetical protein
MKKETRGRKSKMHKPVGATFDQVLGAIAESSYKDEKTIVKKSNEKVDTK